MTQQAVQIYPIQFATVGLHDYDYFLNRLHFFTFTLFPLLDSKRKHSKMGWGFIYNFLSLLHSIFFTYLIWFGSSTAFLWGARPFPPSGFLCFPHQDFCVSFGLSLEGGAKKSHSTVRSSWTNRSYLLDTSHSLFMHLTKNVISSCSLFPNGCH